MFLPRHNSNLNHSLRSDSPLRKRIAEFGSAVKSVALVVSCVSGSLGIAAHGVAYWRVQMNKARESERIVMRLTAVEVVAKDCQEKLTHLDDRYVPRPVLDEREKHTEDLAKKVDQLVALVTDVSQSVNRLALMQTRMVVHDTQIQVHH